MNHDALLSQLTIDESGRCSMRQASGDLRKPHGVALTYMLTLCWIALILLVLVTWAWGQHGQSWHDKYRGVNAMPCCGQRDCRVVHARLIRQTITEVTAEVDGIIVTLPVAAVHQSEDLSDWACLFAGPTIPITSQTIRCLFVAHGA